MQAKVGTRLFKNDYLEKLSHVHPITPLLMWVPFIGWLFYRALAVDGLSVFTVVGLAAVGFLFWTLTEYVLHRYIFHMGGEHPTGWKKGLQFLIHGIHHLEPNDATRLVMPPAPAVILCVIFYTLYTLVFGAALVKPFVSGWLVGYLCYDYIHFAVHHFKPRTKLGKMLKQNHMNHHFLEHEALWGVSSPIWDYVFGTLGNNPRAAAKVREGQQKHSQQQSAH